MSEQALKNALSRKRVAKGNLTRLKEKIVNSVTELDPDKIELFGNKAEALTNEISEIFTIIFTNCEDEQFDNYMEENNVIQDNLDELWLIIKNERSKNSTHNLSSAAGKVELKLPKLTLPTFSGKIEEWLSFSDLFIASIHNNQNLSDAQKLQYLKTACKADALKVIQAIHITDANYAIAWGLLTERFSNKRELVNAIIKRLTTQPNVNDSPQAILDLVDVTNECVRSLQTLDQTVVGFAETLIVYLIVEKLHKDTRAWFERSLSGDALATLEQLLSFLRTHARTLQNSKVSQKEFKRPFNSKFTSLLSGADNSCVYCKGDHILMKCQKFLSLPVPKRVNFVKVNKLCFNCLSNMHHVKDCKSINKCKTCHKFHHSLLHIERNYNNFKHSTGAQNRGESNSLSTEAKVFRPGSQSNSSCKRVDVPSSNREGQNNCDTTLETGASLCASSEMNSHVGKSKQVLLCTAIIRVRDSSGRFVNCRCLLDTGSQANFITEDCLSRLCLDRKHAKIQISCLGSNNTRTNGEVELQFGPHFDPKTLFTSSAFVIRNITGHLPYFSLPPKITSTFDDLILADPSLCKSGPIDILFGINVCLNMFKGETIRRGENLPLAMCSKLGWIISGTVLTNCEETTSIIVNNIQCNMEELVQRFWSLDSVPEHSESNARSKTDKECEDHFSSTHYRENTGRFVVKLPFKESSLLLGDSKEQALRRFKKLEFRLSKQPEIHDSYKRFMKEYLDLGHMELVPNSEVQPRIAYYLPHHAVIKGSSTTTKLRVVFDASAKTSTGVSLNDILMVGPRIQRELFPILLRFRTYPFVVTADIEKMFRQVKLNPEDRDFQRILWRDNIGDPIEEYRLTTVTYGTVTAPFLATRALLQLAMDEEKHFPLASQATLNDFYVDDLLTGSKTVAETNELVKQLMFMMEKGGFMLRKWSSNAPEILENIPEKFKEKTEAMTIDSEEGVKVLGIKWNPKGDYFSFSVHSVGEKESYTKREILSEVSKVFDPLGWLSPCVVYMKIFIQEIWKRKVSWDQPVDDDIAQKWNKFRKELYLLEQLNIPRFISTSESSQTQIHAFCDASEKAYCAAIYIRSIAVDGSCKVNLLTSKTRIAPLKTQSLPRLELCAAVLLANLLQVVLNHLTVPIHNTVAWTDSSVALAWITSEPYRWQTFVATRVAKIQTSIPDVKWYHVPGHLNPADCATRGLYPSELVNCSIWLFGHPWLKESIEKISAQEMPHSETFLDAVVKEEKRSCVTSVAQIQDDHIIFKFSSWSKLSRIVAWCFRFTRNLKTSHSNRTSGFLTSNELTNAETVIIKIVQQLEFSEELFCLSSGKSLHSRSRIISLNPFLDTNGLIRVGGRLRNAILPENRKYPILLPKRHYITELIVKHFHLIYLHAGPQLLLAVIRLRFWILCGRDIVRRIVKSCVTCFRYSASPTNQLMADLPSSRVQPCRAFTRTGTDYAGPFLYKTRNGRGARSYKCYIAIFVCLTTKAVHLELVTDLSTNAFMAALRRFVSRRGVPSEIVSDCGTNFKGASKELKDIYKSMSSLERSEELSNFASTRGIHWRFNPPAAPHFGGIWEAGVKSMKFHIKRVLGNNSFSFEEFATILTQIEACLNSRPLCPISSDPNDVEALTPAHFLIGESLSAIPEPDLTNSYIPPLRRWKMVQRSVQHFWKRWSHEYLAKLQQRPKWFRSIRNVNINDLVLIKNELLPPSQWKLGRIKETFPGSDGMVRVVSVTTANGEIKRPIHKLCLLPSNLHN